MAGSTRSASTTEHWVRMRYGRYMPIDNDRLCTFTGAPNLCGLVGMENCSKSETPKFGLMFWNRLKEDGANGLAPRGTQSHPPHFTWSSCFQFYLDASLIPSLFKVKSRNHSLNQFFFKIGKWLLVNLDQRLMPSGQKSFRVVFPTIWYYIE